DFKVVYNTDEKDLRELQAKGIRSVMKDHTTYDRIKSIAGDIGLEVEKTRDSILVIGETQGDYESFERQIYNNKTYINLEDVTQNIIDNHDFVVYFDAGYIYEEYYLEDMISAFKYVDVDFVTKDKNQEVHNYVSNYESKYLTMFDTETLGKNIEVLGYNTDFVEVSKKENQENEITNNVKELSVIVPIHNNGTYLEEKCFASLKRSSSFSKMEIIFVNDGSTDETTIKIINRLRRRHPDIVYYEFETGSGSASRPRNKGIHLATTELITYLDPDNEASGDGYHKMLEVMKNQDVDMVVGNIIKEDNQKRTAGKYTGTIKKYNFNRLFISDPRDYLIRAAMRVQSIQALIVKKSVIVDNDIVMVEGAAGQD